MSFKEELRKILAQYQKYEGKGRPFTHVIFFAGNDGDEVEHLMCYESQIPGIDAFCKWAKPHFLIVQRLGVIDYGYQPEHT